MAARRALDDGDRRLRAGSVALAGRLPLDALAGGVPVDALVGLGMSVAEAEAALRDVDEDAPIEERVRLALAGSLTGAA